MRLCGSGFSLTTSVPSRSPHLSPTSPQRCCRPSRPAATSFAEPEGGGCHEYGYTVCGFEPLRLPRLAAGDRDFRAAVFPHRDDLRRLGLAHREQRGAHCLAHADGHLASAAHAAAVPDRRRRHVVRARQPQRHWPGARADRATADSGAGRHAAHRPAADLLRASVPRPVGRRLRGLLLRARAAVPAVPGGRLQLAPPLVRRLPVRLRLHSSAATAVVALGEESRTARRVAVCAGIAARTQRSNSQSRCTRNRTS